MNQADLDCITLKSNEDKYDTDFPAILDMEIVRRNALDAIAFISALSKVFDVKRKYLKK
jgi:hypothetical protein